MIKHSITQNKQQSEEEMDKGESVCYFSLKIILEKILRKIKGL
jgi:hypothetical protein